VCIYFGCPLKKNGLGCSSPWKDSHCRTWSSIDGHGSSRGEEGKEEERCRGGVAGVLKGGD
jgi:hypothetical protein